MVALQEGEKEWGKDIRFKTGRWSGGRSNHVLFSLHTRKFEKRKREFQWCGEII
jgi:hypothetical protein